MHHAFLFISLPFLRDYDVKIPSFVFSKRKAQRCLSGNRLSFAELFDDISLMLHVRRICVVVDSLISAAKVCDFVISAWC